jgi:nucleoside-diphosphate-sugar epimerase
MRVLVTGGAGFIGSSVARALAARGDAVAALDYAQPEALVDGVDMLQGDVGDSNSMVTVVRGWHPDAVVHLAAVLTDRCASDIVEGTRANCLGTAVVLDACRQSAVDTVLTVASVAAGGDLRSQSVYGLTKWFSERLSMRWQADNPGVRLVSVRLGWVYGPGRSRGWRDPQGVVEAFARGEQTVHYPDFSQPIDWTYIGDAVEGLIACLDTAPKGHDTIDVGGDLRPISDAIEHLRLRYPTVKVVGHPATAPAASWRMHREFLETSLGCNPATKLEDGLDLTTMALEQATGLSSTRLAKVGPS